MDDRDDTLSELEINWSDVLLIMDDVAARFANRRTCDVDLESDRRINPPIRTVKKRRGETPTASSNCSLMRYDAIVLSDDHMQMWGMTECDLANIRKRMREKEHAFWLDEYATGHLVSDNMLAVARMDEITTFSTEGRRNGELAQKVIRVVPAKKLPELLETKYGPSLKLLVVDQWELFARGIQSKLRNVVHTFTGAPMRDLLTGEMERAFWERLSQRQNKSAAKWSRNCGVVWQRYVTTLDFVPKRYEDVRLVDMFVHDNGNDTMKWRAIVATILMYGRNEQFYDDKDDVDGNNDKDVPEPVALVVRLRFEDDDEEREKNAAYRQGELLRFKRFAAFFGSLIKIIENVKYKPALYWTVRTRDQAFVRTARRAIVEEAMKGELAGLGAYNRYLSRVDNNKVIVAQNLLEVSDKLLGKFETTCLSVYKGALITPHFFKQKMYHTTHSANQNVYALRHRSSAPVYKLRFTEL
nr:MAG: hypothetical protein [Apis mellifra filamentous-like virus]